MKIRNSLMLSIFSLVFLVAANVEAMRTAESAATVAINVALSNPTDVKVTIALSIIGAIPDQSRKIAQSLVLANGMAGLINNVTQDIQRVQNAINRALMAGATANDVQNANDLIKQAQAAVVAAQTYTSVYNNRTGNVIQAVTLKCPSGAIFSGGPIVGYNNVSIPNVTCPLGILTATVLNPVTGKPQSYQSRSNVSFSGNAMIGNIAKVTDSSGANIPLDRQ